MRAINFRFIVFSLWCLIAYVTLATEVSMKPLNKGIVDDFTAEEIELLALTNKERAHKGLQPLKMNKTLTGVAREQSASMARKHHLSHSVNGKNFAYRIKKSGYPFRHVGENVARSKRSFPHVINMWMKSPGHRKNILGRHFKEIGIGIATTPRGDKYFTQVFGAQR